MDNNTLNFIFENQKTQTFNPNHPWVKENKEKIKSLLYNNEIEIGLFPTDKLIKLIKEDTHSTIKKFLYKWKIVFLKGDGLCIAKSEIIKLIDGKCDFDSEFIYSLCEIKIYTKEISGMNLLNGVEKIEQEKLEKPDYQFKEITKQDFYGN